MKNTFKLFGTQSGILCAIVLLAVIGFSMVACDSGFGGGNNDPSQTNPGVNGGTFSGTYYGAMTGSQGIKYIFNSNGTCIGYFNGNEVWKYKFTVIDNVVNQVIEGVSKQESYYPWFYIYNSDTLLDIRNSGIDNYYNFSDLFAKEGSSYPVSGKYKSPRVNIIFDGNGSAFYEFITLYNPMEGPFHYEVSGRKITIARTDNSSVRYFTLDSNTITGEGTNIIEGQNGRDFLIRD